MRPRGNSKWRAALLAAMAIAVSPHVAEAAGPGMSIELNKAETADNACVAAFVMRSDMGQDLDRFSLDLYVFDTDGIIARQLVLDLAPLRNDKTTVVRFPLTGGPCETIGRILVNDVPSCRSAASGEDLDCVTGLSLSSRDRIDLTK